MRIDGLRKRIPALGSVQRRTLLYASAALFASWGSVYFVLVVRAQGRPAPFSVPIVAVVQPKGGDARKGIKYDPFYDSVDASAPGTASLIAGPSNGTISLNGMISSMGLVSSSGDGIGVPDVSFGQPIASSSTTQNGAPASAPSPGTIANTTTPGVSSNGVAYAGRITGTPPIAVLRWPSGATRVLRWHDTTSAGRVEQITPDFIRFANGLKLPYNPEPIARPSASPTPPPFSAVVASPAPMATPTIPLQRAPFAPDGRVRPPALRSGGPFIMGPSGTQSFFPNASGGAPSPAPVTGGLP